MTKNRKPATAAPHVIAQAGEHRVIHCPDSEMWLVQRRTGGPAGQWAAVASVASRQVLTQLWRKRTGRGEADLAGLPLLSYRIDQENAPPGGKTGGAEAQGKNTPSAKRIAPARAKRKWDFRPVERGHNPAADRYIARGYRCFKLWIDHAARGDCRAADGQRAYLFAVRTGHGPATTDRLAAEQAEALLAHFQKSATVPMPVRQVETTFLF